MATSTENELKDHKYHLLNPSLTHNKPGPRGAYEARQVNGGFYVRVDMPGVPSHGVKIFKRGETRTVTFNGKAPRIWPDCENSDRVYGGYVVLDRNPNDIEVETSVVNGSLRLFFPNADGLVHYFVPKERAPQGPVKHIEDGKECCHNKFVKYVATLDDQFMSDYYPGFKNMEMHQSDCTCCKDGHVIEDYGVFDKLDEMESTHINPYLLDGDKGVEDRERIVDSTGDRMYFRIDMPGVGEKDISVRLKNGVTLVCVGRGSQDHSLDEGGRTYAVTLRLRCACCKIIDLKHVMKHGVFRFSIRKHTLPSSSGLDCMMTLLPVF